MFGLVSGFNRPGNQWFSRQVADVFAGESLLAAASDNDAEYALSVYHSLKTSSYSPFTR